MYRLDINSDISIRNQWACQHIVRAVQQDWNHLVQREQDSSGLEPLPRIPEDYKLPPAPAPRKPSTPHDHESGEPKTIKVGIIGAGAAGLFAGLVLDYLNVQLHGQAIPLKFEYDIHEAAGPDRVGGRLFTYNFGGRRDFHDYYDVGAMRFPDNPVMKRTFDLFHRLGMEKIDFKTNPNAPDGSLIPYIMTPSPSSTNPWCYNGITVWGASYANVSASSPTADPFNLDADKAISPDTRQYLATAHPKEKLPKDIHIPAPPYNYETIEWLETFNGGTDWYDQAHSETVLESLDFEFSEKTKWYCVLGGAQQLAKKMEEKVVHKPRYHSPVTSIRALDKMKVELDVRTQQDTEVLTYDAVLSTTTLGCLGRIDTRHAGLRYPVKQAIRSLGYGTSCKVAIKFSRAWWIHDLKDFNICEAGLGHSDLSLRTCVYPSYNIYDESSKTAVLLCSYTWQQDSDRLGSLISTNTNHSHKVADETALKELLLRDLAVLHRNSQISEDELYQLIKNSYLDHHSYDWSEDANTAGAFAFFRPQQFSSMWNRVIRPSGDVIIAGEAASPHHAWVVGALESVVHGLHSWMGSNVPLVPELVHAKKMLESTESGNPFVGLPPYMDKNMSNWHAVMGMVSREKHLQNMGASGGDVLSSVAAHFDRDGLKQEVSTK
ncbi:hypothetical protein FGRMN_657 [Fusarium graminum]|nr:hypothetical protein FGRMN_657 [Fusarium graminum]